jgi:hypothetical protein
LLLKRLALPIDLGFDFGNSVFALLSALAVPTS